MKKYNWKKMEMHARNYDNTCSCCGGWCTEDDVSDMIWDATAEMVHIYNQWTSYNGGLRAYRRFYYLKNRLDRCYTYRFVD